MSCTTTPTGDSANLPFFSAPHRVMLAGGTVQIIGAMLLWGHVMLGRTLAGWEVAAWPWPPAWVHAGLMLFGVFPFFIFGFLMTALPKWAGILNLPRLVYLPTFVLQAAGWGLFYLGLAMANPGLGLAGLFSVLLAWGWGTFQLWHQVLPFEGGSLHARLLVGGMAVGSLALFTYSLALLTLDARWFAAAEALALWAFLVPVFFGVMHRMLPFFSSSVVPGYFPMQAVWPLWVVLAASFIHGACAAAGVGHWSAVSDLVAGVIALWLSRQWWNRRVATVPMLLILHVGSAWLGIAFLLYGAQGSLRFLDVHWGGLVPLHVLTIGYFTSLLVAMATRVTRGHSGRVISEDKIGSLCFWLLQMVLLVRVVGEFVPGANLWAAFAWLAVFALWAWKHMPMYFLSRPDGRPG